MTEPPDPFERRLAASSAGGRGRTRTPARGAVGADLASLGRGAARDAAAPRHAGDPPGQPADGRPVPTRAARSAQGCSRRSSQESSGGMWPSGPAASSASSPGASAQPSGSSILRVAGKSVAGQAIGVVCALARHPDRQVPRLRLHVHDQLRHDGSASLSGDMVRLFRDDLGDVFGPFDILWAAFAVRYRMGAPRRAEQPGAGHAARAAPEFRHPTRFGRDRRALVPTTAAATAGEPDAPLAQPRRQARAPAAATVAHDRRLGRHDRRRRRDRPADQGVRRQPVPHSVLVDGADAALRAAGPGMRGALLRPRAREPVHLPLPRPARGEIVVFDTPPAAR